MSLEADKIALGNGTDAQGLPLPGWFLDQNSVSITRSHKPVWYFKLANSSAQPKAMRKIHRLYKTSPELCWEEKWAQLELECREACPEVIAEGGGLDTRIKRLTAPHIFAGCRTENEKKAAFVGHGDSSADSPISRSLNGGKEAGADGAKMEYDEARIWWMLIESCEKATTEGTRNNRRRQVA